MILYTFQADDGQTIDLPFESKDVPSIGETVEVEGVTYRRVFCGRVGDGTIQQHAKYPYTSNYLNPAAIKGASIVKTATGKKKILIKSAKHEREVMARNDLVKEG